MQMKFKKLDINLDKKVIKPKLVSNVVNRKAVFKQKVVISNLSNDLKQKTLTRAEKLTKFQRFYKVKDGEEDKRVEVCKDYSKD